MRKIFTLLLILVAGYAFAQPYNNEWIDFSKTYYKFKVTADGLYRIPSSVLATAGLSAADAKDFQLFRNGVEVPVYTSVASGPMGPSDYIEFWGQKNDGKADKPLYRNPAYQHTDKVSLQSDTSVYFLTLDPSGSPIHYNTISNDTSTNILPAEPYFMYTTGTYFQTQINPGLAVVLEQYIYSSSYDLGEFWSSGSAIQPVPLLGLPDSIVVDNKDNLFIFNGGPSANFKFGAVGCSDTLRNVQVKLNNTIIKDTALNNFNDLITNVAVPLGTLNTNTNNFQFINRSQAQTYQDRLVVSFYELTYPRQFNFGSQADFQFDLPARATGYFLKISNFNQGGTIPVLYDRNTGQRFVAISNSGILTFALPGSASVRNLVLVSQDPSNITTINFLTKKNFIAYADPLNQGNYLIISNPVLYTGSHGNNPVADYAGYRSSAAGGSFNTQIMDINELTDQFAFGIQKHPLAVKNFINYARNNFGQKPQFVLLIGRAMTYLEYRANQGNPDNELLNLVPTFGYPASDVMLASANGAGSINLIPIGRLGAVHGPEVEDYLTKLKDYESVQQTAANTVAARGWRKNIMHVTGATDVFLEAVLCDYMAYYQQTISDTLFGANVLRFCSSSIDQSNQSSDAAFPQLFSSGIGVLTYFGHSSNSTLGFNLDDPSIYTNQSKYPVMYVNGCYAGNYYFNDPSRLGTGKTLSENYVFIKNKGAIAFIASSHFGVVNYLNLLLTSMYSLMGHADYGKSIGAIESDAGSSVLGQLPTDFVARCQTEEMNIHGDPAITISDEKLPDYDVETSTVTISPSFISVADNHFDVAATFYNLGKAVSDSITVLVTRKYPDGSTSILLKKRIPGIRYADSIRIQVPIVATRDKGQNYITITINSDNNVAEVTTANNTVTTPIFIYQDELTPIYPYDFAIINTPFQKLYASTANPFSPLTQYTMEIDTTEAFNSSLKVTKMISSIGGVFEFDPGIKYLDSTVYYWRTSIVPSQNNPYHWNEFSFIYIDSLKSTVGFNQSHYFQHKYSTLNQIFLDSNNRTFKFDSILNTLYVRNAIYPTGSGMQADFTITYNGITVVGPGCNYNELIFNVFDPVTFKPWKNDFTGPTGLYQSELATCGTQREYNFDYLYTDPVNRKKAMDFLDVIPDNAYVVIRSNVGPNQGDNVYIDQWKADTSLYGHNNSLYHKLFALGFTLLDSFTTPHAEAFVYRKNSPAFIPLQTMTQSIFDKTFISTNCITPGLSGSIVSPVFGPAKKWKDLHWRGNSSESPSTDSLGLQVYGVDTIGNATLLYTLNQFTQDFDISAVNTSQFPYIQLKLSTEDTIHGTPYQLKYWRLNYISCPGRCPGSQYFPERKGLCGTGRTNTIWYCIQEYQPVGI